MFWFCFKSTLDDDVNEQPNVQEHHSSLGSNQWIQAWMTNSSSNAAAKNWTKEILRSMDSSPSVAGLASEGINSQMIEMIAVPLHGTKFLSKEIITLGKFVGETKRDEILNSLSKSPKVKATGEPFPHYLDCRDLYASEESTERASYHCRSSPMTTRESTFDEIYGSFGNDEFHLINDMFLNSEHRENNTSTVDTSTGMHSELMHLDVLQNEALRAYEDALSETSPTFLPSVYRGEFYGSTFRKQI